MSRNDQINLTHLLAICRDGVKPDRSLPWARSLDDGLSAWRPGLPGSPNRGRISNAIRCADDPRAAANWLRRMLALEAEGRHNGPEPMSPIYWGWSWLAELAAIRLLLRPKEGPYAYRDVLKVLEASIDRHTALAALVGAADVVVRPNGRTVYRGPVVLGPGARGEGRHEADNRTAHAVFAACLGIRPAIQQRGVVPRLAAELASEALRDPQLVRQCRSLIGAAVDRPLSRPIPLKAAVAALVGGPLKDIRLAAPFEFYLWEDGRRIAIMRRNNNGNTGAIFGFHMPPGCQDSLQVDYLYPYGDEPRVRSNRKDRDLIGAGRCWWEEGGSLYAENMTAEEEEKKRKAGKKPRRYRAWMPGPPTDPDVLVFIGPNGIRASYR